MSQLPILEPMNSQCLEFVILFYFNAFFFAFDDFVRYYARLPM